VYALSLYLDVLFFKDFLILYIIGYQAMKARCEEAFSVIHDKLPHPSIDTRHFRMILLATGILLIALGLFAGVTLVVAPFGLVSLAPGLTLWLLFPTLSGVGYALVVVSARVAHIKWLTLALSCLLLVLALASAAGLVLSAAAVVHPVTSTLSLWLVLAVAGVFGSISAASYSRSLGQA